MNNINASIQTIAPICPYCNIKTRLTTGREILPNIAVSADKKHWLCDCGAYVGCHSTTSVALGIPANRPTRLARQRLHCVIDNLWQNAGDLYDFKARNIKSADILTQLAVKRARNRVYAWLAHALDLEVSVTHVAMFDLDACQRSMAALDRVTYSDIKGWARSRERHELREFIHAKMAPVTAAAGLMMGMTGPKIPDSEDFSRDAAITWLRIAKPRGLTLTLGSTFDVGCAEAASELGIPYTLVINPAQKTRSDPTRIQAALVAAAELHIIDGKKILDAWTSVRRQVIWRIDALAVLTFKKIDPLVRGACSNQKILFDIRRDLVVDGYWNDDVVEEFKELSMAA